MCCVSKSNYHYQSTIRLSCITYLLRLRVQVFSIPFSKFRLHNCRNRKCDWNSLIEAGNSRTYLVRLVGGVNYRRPTSDGSRSSRDISPHFGLKWWRTGGALFIYEWSGWRLEAFCKDIILTIDNATYLYVLKAGPIEHSYPQLQRPLPGLCAQLFHLVSNLVHLTQTQSSGGTPSEYNSLSLNGTQWWTLDCTHGLRLYTPVGWLVSASLTYSLHRSCKETG